MSVHDAVRQEMLAIYREGDYRIAIGSKKVDYADTAARNLFAEGCSNFQRFKLQNECFITSGQHCYVIPRMGIKLSIRLQPCSYVVVLKQIHLLAL